MKLEPTFIVAALLATTGFVMTGGVHATAQAVKAEEGQPVAAAAAVSETSIPFANMGSIRDWQAIDDSSLYVQDMSRNWYLAKLIAPCTDLTFANAVGFETKGLNQLDRFGTVIVRGQRCQMISFVTSGPPPAKTKAARAAPK